MSVNDLKRVEDISEFEKSFIKSYNEERDEWNFLEVDIQHPGKLGGRMKIERVRKLVANLYDKTEYAIHIANLKQALNHRLLLRKGTESDKI